MKYLVMECHTAYAVVLGDDGRFLKVANMHYEVGQTVTNVVEMVLPQREISPETKPGRRWIPALASMAACLVLVLGGLYVNFMPYASVYMAINPEVRIDVSRTDRVVEVTGVNADGQSLLQGYQSGSDDLDLVMDELVDRAIDMGYLHEGGKITLTLDAGEKWVTSHERSLNDHLTRHLEDKISVTIDIEPQKPARNQPPQSTWDAQSVEIPVGSESDYGVSDYGNETEEGDSSYEDSPDSGFGVDGDSGYDNADSGYGASDSVYDHVGSDSGYDVPEEHESDYAAPEDEADSAYEEQDPQEDSDSEYDD